MLAQDFIHDIKKSKIKPKDLITAKKVMHTLLLILSSKKREMNVHICKDVKIMIYKMVLRHTKPCILDYGLETVNLFEYVKIIIYIERSFESASQNYKRITNDSKFIKFRNTDISLIDKISWDDKNIKTILYCNPNSNLNFLMHLISSEFGVAIERLIIDYIFCKIKKMQYFFRGIRKNYKNILKEYGDKFLEIKLSITPDVDFYPFF